jgi:hypothetical protein
MTIMDPGGAVSTKWVDNFGAAESDAATICTVYAGPATLILVDEVGESIQISGTRPPWGIPSLMSASEISQVEKAESGSLDSGICKNRKQQKLGQSPKPSIKIVSIHLFVYYAAIPSSDETSNGQLGSSKGYVFCLEYEMDVRLAGHRIAKLTDTGQRYKPAKHR